MATTSFATVAAFLKEHYYLNASTIPDATYGESFTYALVAKNGDETWGGKNAVFPIVYGHNQSGSATFATAQTNSGNVAAAQWQVPSSGNKKHYWFAQFPTDVIRAMEGSQNSYVPHVTTETDSVMKAAARRLAIELHRDGWGQIGKVLSVSTITVTLTDASDCRNFEYKMKVVGAAAKTTGALRSATAAQVVGIDEDAGTVTFDQDVSGLSWATNDILFVEGDRQNTGSPVKLKVLGFETYNPFDRTTIGTLFNVDRTIHKTRLAGSYLDGTNMQRTEAIRKLAATMADRGANLEYGICSYSVWNEIISELGSQKEYSDVEVAGIGFGAIKLRGPKGKKLEIVPDNACPSNRIRFVTKDAFQLLSLGKPIGFLDEDDIGPILRLSSSDAYETRVGGYIEGLAMKPLDLGVISTDGA